MRSNIATLALIFATIFVTLVTSAPLPVSNAHATHKSASKHLKERGLIGDLFKGGVATFFKQDGNPGACGQTHSDDDMIAALDSQNYGNTSKKSNKCGKKLKVTNKSNNKSVTVTVADACPTCKNKNSVDLSVAAFNKIAKAAEGEVPIVWEFVGGGK